MNELLRKIMRRLFGNSMVLVTRVLPLTSKRAAAPLLRQKNFYNSLFNLRNNFEFQKQSTSKLFCIRTKHLSNRACRMDRLGIWLTLILVAITMFGSVRATNCSAADATKNCVDGLVVPIW
ncbi:hypothetical protein DICVIV_07813 [Dictyocaulus viviparus]|uniref:Uncharacterized protein n=1 Tax=Dictyocaulus viviparus TaxID=29172 RepID=A0A0D8XN92_DICVI|nr:hypothetical protein DICVIV_07813 [Dictyocaulus viviparus]